MKKSRRTLDRRKHPRTQGTKAKRAHRAAPDETTQNACFHCGKDLKDSEKALFVEEEVGRIFCSEDCITAFFQPEIVRMEKAYQRLLSPNDLSQDERDGLNHLRWVTLQEPDEVWREKTVVGDFRYTLISEFKPSAKSVWYVCICLFLRGEPSFLFLGFPTRNAGLVSHYRKGERVQWVKAAGAHPGASEKEKSAESPSEEGASATDRLADAWTDDETLRAEQLSLRKPEDISQSEFDRYRNSAQETLEEPSELWIYRADEQSLALYQFIRHYPDEKEPYWYVVVARETEDDEQIEILDAFPTRDLELVNKYRKGEQEIGENFAPASRVVH